MLKKNVSRRCWIQIFIKYSDESLLEHVGTVLNIKEFITTEQLSCVDWVNLLLLTGKLNIRRSQVDGASCKSSKL